MERPKSIRWFFIYPDRKAIDGPLTKVSLYYREDSGVFSSTIVTNLSLIHQFLVNDECRKFEKYLWLVLSIYNDTNMNLH